MRLHRPKENYSLYTEYGFLAVGLITNPIVTFYRDENKNIVRKLIFNNKGHINKYCL